MAIATRKKKQGMVMQLVMVPLDWLEERSGLVGGVKYFLFRKVPRDTSWWHTLGSATLTAFLVQLGTGVILAFYYKPHPDSAFESVETCKRRNRFELPSPSIRRSPSRRAFRASCG